MHPDSSYGNCYLMSAMKTLLPLAGIRKPSPDFVSLYGFRPDEPSLWFLSLWEFFMWVDCERVGPPSPTYKWSVLTAAGQAKKKESSRASLEPGIDFLVDEAAIRKRPHVFMLAANSKVFDGNARSSYEIVRNS